MGCGVARNANGSISVVVAAGFSDPESAPGTYLDTVEIFSVEGGFWTSGNKQGFVRAAKPAGRQVSFLLLLLLLTSIEQHGSP